MLGDTTNTLASISLGNRMSSSSATYNCESLECDMNGYPEKSNIHQGLLCHRKRLSSAGDGNSDLTTSTSGSSCSEKDEGSDYRGALDTFDCGKRPAILVTDHERQQVETFFGGLKTQVFVSGSLANLYSRTSSVGEWGFKFTGIPVVVLDMGESRARDKRKIQIMLVELGTCFALWRDTIDNLSAYCIAGKAFHTMYCSADHTLQMGFSYDTTQAASEMWQHMEKLIACPENISLSTPSKKKLKKKGSTFKPAPLPPKSHISQPCCFQHVTCVERKDAGKYYTLQELISPKSS